MSADSSLEFNIRQKRLLTALISSKPDELYEKIIALGRAIPQLRLDECRPDYQVYGCQSLMFVKTTVIDQRASFEIYSDALISRGLAAIACQLYGGLDLEQIISSQSELSRKLDLESALSNQRLGGLSSIITKMQQDALRALIALKG